MEVGYDMLWRVCSWFLVSFLVTRLVSLFVSLNSSNSACGHVNDSSFKGCVDGGDDHGGKKLKVVGEGRRVTKRVKFDDQLVKVVEFDAVDGVFLRDVEMDFGQVNVVDDGEVISDVVNKELIDEEKVVSDDCVESCDFGEQLVDQIVERGEFVGGEDEVGVNNVDGGDEIVGCGAFQEKERVVHYIKNGNVEFGYEEVHDSGDKVVDDDQSKEVSLSNVQVGEEKSGVVESVGHSVEGIVKCKGNEGYGIGVGLGDDPSNESSSSNVRSGKSGIVEFVGHSIEGVLKCQDNESYGIGVDLDDEPSKGSSSSNVGIGGEESGIVEFAGHSIEGIAECGHKEGDALDVGLEFDQSERVSPSNVHKEEESGTEVNLDEGILSDDDEWEGIERSELEKKFASAMNFVECQDTGGRLAKVESDVMTQLYGLQKVAMEGQCHEPQPMALKLSARAKWNAWQRLGNMSHDEAMEQYVDLLSNNISGWMEDRSYGRNDIKNLDTGADSLASLESSTSLPSPDKE